MANVKGHIWSWQGAEITGAKVTIWDLNSDDPNNDERPLHIWSGHTDEHGRFEGQGPLWALFPKFRMKVEKASREDWVSGDLIPPPPLGSDPGPLWAGGAAIEHPESSGLQRANDTAHFGGKVGWHPAARLPDNEPEWADPPRAMAIDLNQNVYEWATWNGIPGCKELLPGALPPSIPPPDAATPEFLFGVPPGTGWLDTIRRHENNRHTIAGRHSGEDRYQDFSRFFDQYDQSPPRMPIPQVIADDYSGSRKGFPSDASFAWQRLAGPNPMVLKALHEFFKDDFPFQDKVVLPRKFGGRGDWERALGEQRLFIADYRDLAGVEQTGGRYLPAPFALFYWNGDRGDKKKTNWKNYEFYVDRRRVDIARSVTARTGFSTLFGAPVTTFELGEGLVPVAIQLDHGFDAITNPIFSPLDNDERGDRWGVAKLMVQIADLNHHEMKSHLVETHLAMEPFKVAMERCFYKDHPLYELLSRHFVGMLHVNHLAYSTLVAPGGGVDQLLSNSLGGTLELARRAWNGWNFGDKKLKRELEARDVLDRSILPVFPYRDDALLVWDAIAGFVREYVSIYYVNDAAVVADWELARWLGELDQKVDGVPSHGGMTRDGLIEVITQVIFTCSAQHAALNFTQFHYMGFVPNMPAAARERPLRSDGTVDTDLLNLLPDAEDTRAAVELVANLGRYQFQRLGHYPKSFADPDAEQAAVRFREALEHVAERIDEANQNNSRRASYPYLLPSRIPNSINV